MSKLCTSPYQVHRFERTNSITSHLQGLAKPKIKNLSRHSTKTNTSKSKKSSNIPRQSSAKKKTATLKDQNKTTVSNRKVESRDGFPMTSSVNIPDLSPASRYEFTRNNSLQFTTHLGDQSSNVSPLTELFQRTQLTFLKYEQTTNRLSTRNKEISRKLAQANQQILQL